MRIVASLTTIPSRIGRIRLALESIINQTIPIECVEINIPYICQRTGQTYDIPDWLAELQPVKIFRTEDFGPITKVAPTLLRHTEDRDTYIWSCDDDVKYPANQLALLVRYHRQDICRIIARYGGRFCADGSIQFMFGATEVSMFEGYGTVLYPPGCISDDFLEFVRLTSENADCRISDDLVLSHYFTEHRIPIYLCNQPSPSEPYNLTGFLEYAGEADALNNQSGGHLARYIRVRKFLQSLEPLCPSRCSTPASTDV